MIKKVNTFYWTLINFSTNFTRLVEVFEEIPEIKNYEEWKEYKYKSWEIKIKNCFYMKILKLKINISKINFVIYWKRFLRNFNW